MDTYLASGSCCAEHYVPWQHLVDLADWVVGDAFEDVVEIELRVEAVELGSTEQRVDRGSSLTAGVGAAEEVILPSERNGAQRTFGPARPRSMGRAGAGASTTRSHCLQANFGRT